MDDLIAKCGEAAGLLKEFSHPQRLRLLCHLAERERTVTELEGLCRASQSRVSQFLGHLRDRGLVSARREGKYVHYRIADPNARKLIQALRKIFCA